MVEPILMNVVSNQKYSRASVILAGHIKHKKQLVLFFLFVEIVTGINNGHKEADPKIYLHLFKICTGGFRFCFSSDNYFICVTYL